MTRLSTVLCCWCLLWTALAYATDPATFFSDDAQAERYDCVLAVKRHAGTATPQAVRVLLEGEPDTPHLRVTIRARAIIIETVHGRKRTRYGAIRWNLPADATAHLTILRRGTFLGIEFGGALLFRGDVPRLPGAQAGYETDSGWTVEDARLQPLEPVAFADDFMRTADAPGAWTVASGQWTLQSAWAEDPHRTADVFGLVTTAQNPFAWAGRNPDGKAFCTTGYPFWEEYTYTVAVRPAAQGVVGVAVNLTDAHHGILLRWSSVADPHPTGNALIAYRMTGGILTPLATTRGGFLPGQWYRMTVVSTLAGLQVLIDGRERLTLKQCRPWRGGVGLYAEGEGALFDDVTVYGRTLNTEVIAERRQARINQRFRDDKRGMKEWVHGDWVPVPGSDHQWVHRWPFYGDHGVTVVVNPLGGTRKQAGTLSLWLNTDGTSADSGYRADLRQLANNTTGHCTLSRDAAVVASCPLPPLEANTDATVRLRREGRTIRVEVEGETLLTYTDPQPRPGRIPAYSAEGRFARISDAVAVGRQVMDDLFANAPVDWRSEGTWMPTPRWACAPQWSFFGGWSRGDVALWHKQRFSGDHLFEAYVALKMEYPRERETYYRRYRDFGITICGDGHNPRSGYTGIFGAPDATGTPNKRTVLLRNGVEVASGAKVIPEPALAHHDWFDLALHKDGRTITFWVEGQPTLRYDDPDPIDTGVPAVWSTDNGIALARARLHFAQPPQPRSDQPVALDASWYPEWANVGQPMRLDFPTACAASGKPVHLEVTARSVPSDHQAPPVVTPRSVSVTPTVPGNYWYELRASDGRYRSPAFHLTVPAFTPTLGRDDSHAVVLYRFTEGQGKTVHDQSTVTPALDLTVPRRAEARWLPEQGLWIDGATTLMSAGSAGKLMRLATQRAGTLECWISAETVYPLTDWSSALLAWEQGSNTRNLAIGHSANTLLVAVQGSGIDEKSSAIKVSRFRTGLQHYVVTWNGAETQIYQNGRAIATSQTPWATARWTPDAPLLLGNQLDGNRGFMGTYYLVAIHDVCFTDAQVKRHYDAGPSAR